MKVQFKYAGQSDIVSDLSTTRVGFATNVLREPSYFNGELSRPLVCREGLGALHSVVVSDLKYRPKDRLAFRTWLEEQDRAFLAALPMTNASIQQELEAKELRLAELRELRKQRREPFIKARHKYFDYAYENQWELDELLDPVITVHPDELSFEAFSKDESSYGRLAIKYDLFGSIDAFECGTTNIDFSSRLAERMNRMRSYRSTRFDVDPRGFTVTSADGAHKEKKIELPPSWVKGFLEVQSVMSMGLSRIRLTPVDLFSIIRLIRRNKAKTSPRALRFELRPGERTRVVFEPWNEEMLLSPSSVYEGDKPQTIRTWGRRRLVVLERLLAHARFVDVYLAGHGLPTIYVCDLGDATFTLGLSGWTDNDWTGDASARMALLNRSQDVDGDALAAAYAALREPRYANAEDIADKTSMSLSAARSALSSLCQAGRAMMDLGGGVYRHRDLFSTPFDAKKEAAKLKQSAESSDPKAVKARAIMESGQARIIARRPVFEQGVAPADGGQPGYKISGSVAGAGSRVRPMLHVDATGHIITAKCTCPDFAKFKLTKGPCEHVLALRLAHMARLEEEGRAM